MDTQRHDTEATVIRDGLTVRQTYAQERFDIPTVALELDSARDEPVRARLVVDLPAALDIDEVGFHPNFRRDSWTVENGRLAFEADVPSDRTITTMYAIETLQPDQLDALLANLHIDRVSVAPGEASGPTDDAADPDSTDHDGEETPDAWSVESVDASADAPDSDLESEWDAARAGETADRRADRTGLSAYSAMDLVTELVARLSGADSRTDTGRVQSVLPEKTGQSLVEDNRRVTDLQRRMSDVEAVLEPIRELPDYDPVETFEGLDDRFETLAEDVDAVAERVDGVAEKVDERMDHVDERTAEIDARIDTVAEDVETVTDDVDALAATVEQIADDVAELSSDVATIESNQQSLESEVSGLSEWRANVKNVLRTIGE